MVRLSGPSSKEVLKSLWKNPASQVDNFITRRLYYGNFVSPSTGELLDSGFAVWMKAPHSYTGEDVVELQGHGSPLVMEKLVQAAINGGAVAASPGEFTKRAYLNGKIDLAQAEGVADLIGASSEAALFQAKEHLIGKLSQKIGGIQSELVKLRAFVEASIDFPEENIEMIQKNGVLDRLAPIEAGLKGLLETYEEGRFCREGVRTVLVGRPNVGKSSLMNALLGTNRAIVHHKSGTTRDVVEEWSSFGGYTFQLMDTAGLRKTPDEVEALGMERTTGLLGSADLLLWILDGSSPLEEADFDFLATFDPKKAILCVNKVDLGLAWDPTALLNGNKASLCLISALKGDGISELQKKMTAWVKGGKRMENTGVVITKLRHKEALESTLQELSRTRAILEEKGSVEFAAHHLGKAHQALGMITGTNISEELLDSIFSEFCIGK